MKKQTGNFESVANSRRALPRFGLKLMFVLLTAISIAAAWLFQPQYTTSCTCDFTKLEAAMAQRVKAARARGATRCFPFGLGNIIEDHCIRIRTPKIIDDALESSEDLKAFADAKSAKPVQWIYEHVEAVPVGKFKVRVTAIGDASEAKELQHLAETLPKAYRDYLQNGGVLFAGESQSLVTLSLIHI